MTTLSEPASGEAATALLSLQHLTIGYRTRSGMQAAVQDLSLEINPGEVVALVGESGSGKTTTGQAILGLLASNGEVLSGEIRHDGADIAKMGSKALRQLRGKRISLIPQDPGVSLDPVRRVGKQIEDVLVLHTDLDKGARGDRVHELLSQVGFSDVERRARQYPHELSGGMRQRVLIAIAIACEPDLIIADEPTSGLDVTVQKRVLDLLDDLRAKTGTAIVFVTHDLGVAADRSDRIAVMQSGKLVEVGATSDIIEHPTAPYTRHLLDSVPSRVGPVTRPEPSADAPAAIEAHHLTKLFTVPGAAEDFRAVDDVSFAVPGGSTLAIVGESGSGKSTTARMLIRLIEPTSGEVSLAGTNVTRLSLREFRRQRRNIQIVYQNPYASFDPRFSVHDVIEEPLRAFGIASRDRVVAALERAALPASYLERSPAELSGGQRQRVAIARALVLEPKVVVLDEPISALDVSVQAQILDLLAELQQRLGLTYVFISHDLSVVRAISDQVLVMQHGRAVESGPTNAVFNTPRTEYTAELIAAIPGRRLAAASGGDR